MNYVKQLGNLGENRPFLFSYRRCPYAMRARMALLACEIDFDIQEISLKDKPKKMLNMSPKGTVPVLVYKDLVIDESLDIMDWAKEKKNNKYIKIDVSDMDFTKKMIDTNDGDFKKKLDLYKYTSVKEYDLKKTYRKDCEDFIKKLDERLVSNDYLLSNTFGYLDIAIFPFIRQFFNVDSDWLEKNPYTNLKRWVKRISISNLFIQIMQKPKV